ncbi:MAG: sialate O-acetylesterase [Planctomycetaceae bacterium]
MTFATRIRTLAVLLLELAVVACLPAAEPRGDLWILSGQSNACGRAKLPGPDASPRVTIFDPQQKRFVVAQDPLPHMGTVGTGPWVAAAKHVSAAAEQPVRMCGFASGGKPIAFWHVGQPGYKGLFPVIEQAGQRADVFLWYQGESDSRRLTQAAYQRELTEHVARVRRAAGNPNMLAVIVQLGPYLAVGRSGYMGIREAQRQFVINDKHAVLVPALGRTLKDSVHLDNAGYRELGRAIGRAVLRARHRQSNGNWPGPVLDAAVSHGDEKSRSRNTVVAHFAEVQQITNALAADFAVLDAEGTNPCLKIESAKTLVTLTLQRDIAPPARLVYGFGTQPKATLTDESGNRAPAVQLDVRSGELPEDAPGMLDNGAGRQAD